MAAPDGAPGVFLRASAFTEHWVTYGYGAAGSGDAGAAGSGDAGAAGSGDAGAAGSGDAGAAGSGDAGDDLDVFYTGNLILKPLLPRPFGGGFPSPTDGKGRNLVTFADQDKLLTSGFCWPKTLELLAGTPYVTYQSLEDGAAGSGDAGHVIAFTDDPNYRAMYPGVQRLFINAALFGPGH